MSQLRPAAATISAIYAGSSAASKVYAGDVLVYDASGLPQSQPVEFPPFDGYTQRMPVALSYDGSRLVVGRPQSNSYNGTAQVFDRSGSSWQQVGETLEGTVKTFGSHVAINWDGSLITVADGDSVNTYFLSGQTWVLAGSTGNIGAPGGLLTSPYWAEQQMALSSDGSVLAVTEVTSHFDYNIVHILEWSGSSWDSRYTLTFGRDIWNARSLSLSSDGSSLAVGTHYGGGNVRFFEWSGTYYIENHQKDIDYQLFSGVSNLSGMQIGHSVSLSPDGSRVAVGAPYAGKHPLSSGVGLVRVYDWTGSAWSQVGQDLYGKGAYVFGASVALSGDGDVLVVGQPGFEDNSTTGEGAVSVFALSDGEWVQDGVDLESNIYYYYLGARVAVSADGMTFAAGGKKGARVYRRT